MSLAAYKDRRYEVGPCNTNWPREFEAAADKLRTVFGSTADIQHIGSTAVPGMDGKPVIDILVLVDNVSAAETHRQEIENLGYVYAGEFVMPGAILFRKMNGDTLLSNVHIFERSHPHVREMLRLRDYLRDNPGEAKAYSDLKRDLYAKYKDCYAEYRKRKDEYMASLKKRAEGAHS